MSVIVILGASAQAGRRVAAKLLDEGVRVRLVARDISTLDSRAERIVGRDVQAAATACSGAEIVVSFLRSDMTPELLRILPAEVRQVALTGSAWRNSRVPNPDADDVRAAEQAFLASGRDGVMLHPTMLYGEGQRSRVASLMRAIARFPVLPLPGGGRNLVQPLHVDDLAACVIAAINRSWNGPTLLTVAGAGPITLAEMARACAEKVGRRCAFVPVPLGLSIALLRLAERLRIPLPIHSTAMERFREDVSYPVDVIQRELGVTPRPFTP